MPLQIRQGGAWQTIRALRIFSGGAWRTIKAVKIYADGAWRDAASFVGDLSLALSASSVTRTGTSSSITTSTITATPTGGLSPYTYAWVRQSGAGIAATFPTTASTAFRATGMVVDETRTAVFRCTCTDTLGTTATADVTVTITYRSSVIIGGSQ